MIRKQSPKPLQQRDDSGPLKRDALRRLYAAMLKCRMVEGHIARVVHRRHLPKDYVPAIGREATEVGATLDLGADDVIAPARRSLVAHIVRGVSLAEIFQGLLQARQPTEANKGGLKILPAPRTLAAQLAMASGMAFANRMLGKEAAVIALAGYAGDKSLQPVLEYASANRLPVVFVLETQARVGTRLDEGLMRMGSAAQMPGLVVDGNDAIAVYRVAHEAIKRARQGYGPALIECRRERGHSRRAANGRSNSAADPLTFMEQFLEAQGLWAGEWKKELVEQYGKEIAEALGKVIKKR